MPLIVHHYFPLGTKNLGDQLAARAIQQSIPRHFGPCEFVDLPVNDRYDGPERTIGLRGENLQRTNAEADLVIVGGSNLLEPRRGRRGDAGLRRKGRWSVFTDVDSLRLLKPPVLLLGMGTGSSFGKPIRRFTPPALDEVRLLHQKAFASAVRDIATVRQMNRIGIETECTGCPVTFLTDRPIVAGSAGYPLLVSFPPISITTRPMGNRFMNQAMNYVRWLRDQKIPVIVTLHDSRDIEPARQRVPKGVEVFYTADLDQQIARFQASRGVIGFRLHAALLGVGLGKPVIPVGLDWRGRGFIDTFQIRDLSIRALRPGQFWKLRRLTRRLLNDDPEILSRLSRKKLQQCALHERFLARAASVFRNLIPFQP